MLSAWGKEDRKRRSILKEGVRLASKIGFLKVTEDSLVFSSGHSAMTIRKYLGHIADIRALILVAISKQVRGHPDPYEPIEKEAHV